MLQMEKNNFTLLLKLAQTGQSKHYEECLILAANFFHQRLKKHIRQEEIREEIVQEALIGLHKNLFTFNPTLNGEAWLSTILKYKMIDYFRKHKKHHRVLAQLIDDVTIHELQTNSMHNDETWNNEEIISLRDMLLELSQNPREALIKTKIEGKSTKVAAEELGLRENALRTQISRGIQTLKKLYHNKHYEKK